MVQPAASPGSRAAPGSSAGRADRRLRSTVAATATASYLLAHHTGTQAAATESTHGYALKDTILISAPPATAAADAAPAPQLRK